MKSKQGRKKANQAEKQNNQSRQITRLNYAIATVRFIELIDLNVFSLLLFFY